jgi:hypothetical protein
VERDELVKVLDAEVGREDHDALIARSIDPDQTVLRFHFAGDVP